MSVVKMKTLSLIGMQADRAEILQQLAALGYVEISDAAADGEAAALLTRDSADGDSVQAQDVAERLTRALAAVFPYLPKRAMFAQKPTVTKDELLGAYRDREQVLRIADEISAHVSSIDALRSEAARLAAQNEFLEPWLTLDVDLRMRPTRHVELLCGTRMLTQAPLANPPSPYGRSFLAGGLYKMLFDWLKNGADVPEEEMARTLMKTVGLKGDCKSRFHGRRTPPVIHRHSA